jgi:hypothetical protein
VATKESPSASAQKALRQIERSFAVLERNFNRFLQAESYYIVDWSLIGNQKKLADFEIEYATLIHNYLASWKGYVDICRRACTKVNDKDFQKALVSEKKQRRLQEETNFVQNLRDYELHNKLPLTGFSWGPILDAEGLLTLKPIGYTKGLPSVQIDDLLADLKWGEPSKAMLKEMRKTSLTIQISPHIVPNQNVTKAFHDWVVSALRRLI